MSDLTSQFFCDGKKMKQPPVTESFYEPRNPKAGHYYQCIEANFKELEMAWDDPFSSFIFLLFLTVFVLFLIYYNFIEGLNIKMEWSINHEVK